MRCRATPRLLLEIDVGERVPRWRSGRCSRRRSPRFKTCGLRLTSPCNAGKWGRTLRALIGVGRRQLSAMPRTDSDNASRKAGQPRRSSSGAHRLGGPRK